MVKTKPKFRLLRFTKKTIDEVDYLCCKIIGKVPGKTLRELKNACNESVNYILAPPVQETNDEGQAES